jgi:hypothetical protein
MLVKYSFKYFTISSGSSSSHAEEKFLMSEKRIVIFLQLIFNVTMQISFKRFPGGLTPIAQNTEIAISI